MEHVLYQSFWDKFDSIISRPQYIVFFYPTLACEYQCFRVWVKFVFPTLELTATPTNLTSQVKVGHALDQSLNVQSWGPERAHQNKTQTQTQTQTKFIQQKYIQVPYQVYMSFLEMQITL